MNTKICFKCLIQKDLTEYYKHPQMGDGHLNKCKTCTKKDTAARSLILISTEEGLENERARNRDKYYRLNYREKHKPTPEEKKVIMDKYKSKYPEKRKANNFLNNAKKTPAGLHFHHWSYNKEHYLDIIELSSTDHYTAHRFIIYDQERMMYRTKDGILLDSREAHENYILSKIRAA